MHAYCRLIPSADAYLHKSFSSKGVYLGNFIKRCIYLFGTKYGIPEGSAL
jgi:hypothetical protein